MPYYYAICSIDDQEITERVITEFFANSMDTLCKGPYSGHQPFESMAICFFVRYKETFLDIAKRLTPEGITFWDEDGKPIEFETE